MPQRGRGGLRAFTPDLQPALDEVGIDMVKLSVIGHWRALPTTHDCLSVEEYFEHLVPSDDPNWFRVERTSDGIMIRTRAEADTTLGELKLTVNRQREPYGRIRLAASCNLTRTMHHLLIMHGHLGSQFTNHLQNLAPLDFFARAPGSVPLGFGKADNWISDYAVMIRCLGPSPFRAFNGIFVEQLQRLIHTLILPFDGLLIRPDGTSLVAQMHGIECRVDWGAIRFSHVEAYFERRHSHAVGAVRLLSTAALADFGQVKVWRYITNDSLWSERHEDQLTVGITLRDNHELAIYAKASGRIRFEVRRRGKGTKVKVLEGPATPLKRAVDVLCHSQSYLLEAARWQTIGPLLDEHPAPQMNDLVFLCSAIQSACAAHHVEFQSVLKAILDEGGLVANPARGVTEELVQNLIAAGILHRPVARVRDHRSPTKRYALRPVYRGLTNLMSRALLEGHTLTAEQA